MGQQEAAEVCTLGGEYAHSISMDYCIDKAEGVP